MEWSISYLPKGICPKVNVMLWLVFEFAYYDVVVQQASLYAMAISPCLLVFKQ